MPHWSIQTMRSTNFTPAFFQELHCFNRCADGVIKHAATREDYFGADAHVKYIEIVDAVTGRTTDEFYGARNYFNMTALAKATKGEKFFVYGFDVEPVKRMLRLFQQAKSGKWVRKDY